MAALETLEEWWGSKLLRKRIPAGVMKLFIEVIIAYTAAVLLKVLSAGVRRLPVIRAVSPPGMEGIEAIGVAIIFAAVFCKFVRKPD